MDYRLIWEKVNGKIPVDENGRKYEIHHIDGNSKNNSIENLKCVSIQEHYEIHYNQGDFAAANAIGVRMKKPIKGWKHSTETVEKIRKANLGKPGSNKGRVWSEEINEKRRQTLLSKNPPKETKRVSGNCIYCAKPYKRLKSHEKSCKLNPDRVYRPLSKESIEKRQNTRNQGVGYSTMVPKWQKGCTPWNKGLTRDKNETVDKVAKAKEGKKRPAVSPATREKLKLAVTKSWEKRRLKKLKQ